MHYFLLKQKNQLLEALSPKLWVKRGFAIVRNKSGKAIRSVKETSLQENLIIELSDGEINAKAEGILSQKESK